MAIKKATKNVKVIEYLEKVATLEFRGEPTDDDVIKIISSLNGGEYQTELTTFERRRHVHYTCYYREEDEAPEVTTIYILNIYKKVLKEVDE